MKEIAVVYMVAGISSRFGGKIKQFAKVTENETLIEYSIKQAISARFTKIIFIVGNKTKQPFKEMFGSNYLGIPVYYALQMYDENKRDRPWGTGAALCAIKEIINCPFVVCNGDDIYGGNTFKVLFEHIQESEDAATIGYKLGDVLSDIGGVNRAIFETKEGYVKKITENFNITKENLDEKGLTGESMASQNIFALYPETVEMLDEEFKKFEKEHEGDRKAEFLLSNELSNLIEPGKLRMKLLKTPDAWIGVTNPGDEETVRNFLKDL